MTQDDPATLDVVICGVARNCARSIERDIRNLQRAAPLFRRVQVLVVESDSSDDTLAILQAMRARDPAVRCVSLGQLRERHPKRTERIAMARNACLDELAANPIYATASHMIMVDLDGMCRHLTRDALASCWAADAPPWDVCGANQGDYYYDVWTIRHPQWCPGDCHREQELLVPLLGRQAADEVAIFSRMVHIAPTRPWIEVDSAFGGLAVYRRASIGAARYVGLDEQGREVCDHVGLHLSMRAQGRRIFINPALINARSTKHAGRKKFWRTLRRKLWNKLRGHE
jgi:glycosyltransferase involved in cell wall biosynthesis